MAAPAGLNDVKMPDGTTKKIGEPVLAYQKHSILAVNESGTKIEVHSKWMLGLIEFYITSLSASSSGSGTKKVYYDRTDGSLYLQTGTGHTDYVTLTWSISTSYGPSVVVATLDFYNDDTGAENIWVLRRT